MSRQKCAPRCVPRGSWELLNPLLPKGALLLLRRTGVGQSFFIRMSRNSTFIGGPTCTCIAEFAFGGAVGGVVVNQHGHDVAVVD